MKLLSTSAQAKYLMMRSHDEKDSVEDDDDEKNKKKVKKPGLVSEVKHFVGLSML